MSGDIKTFWDVPNSRGDWLVSAGALASGDDLVTAILVSIFTDGRANADDVIPDGTLDRRGWWGDAGQGSLIGSRLWLIDRSKLTNDVAARAKDYIAESLQWLIDDDVVARFDITTQITFPSMLGVQVMAFRRDGAVVALRFPSVWSGVN